MKKLVVVILMFVFNLIIPALNAHAKTGWQTFTSDFVGYSITYPDFLKEIPWTILHPQAEPTSSAQWRTTTFRSSDGEVSLIVNTSHTDGTLSELFDYAQHSGAERFEREVLKPERLPKKPWRAAVDRRRGDDQALRGR
jgi:hypothetical protein